MIGRHKYMISSVQCIVLFVDAIRKLCILQTCGRIAIYVWLFLSNLAYVISFAYTWSFGVAYIGSMNYMSSNQEDDDYYYGYDYEGTEGLRNTLFAFLLIYTFTFSILNMYTICLVSKFGCCFVEGMDAEMNNRAQNNASQPLQVRFSRKCYLCMQN